ncbi:MAG: hypothetical protein ACI9JN_001858 [Bacteroidia bacterium]|jgi:hypothetical protein
MLFKRLPEKDLKALEKEFVEFLVLNGIVADDWIKLKADSPQNASKMVDAFSDAVYAGMMRKVKYLERIGRSEIMCFYCQHDQIVLVGLETSDESVDFTTMNDLTNLTAISQEIQVYTTTKEYDKPREQEIFDMIENGASLGGSTLFNALCLAL